MATKFDRDMLTQICNEHLANGSTLEETSLAYGVSMTTLNRHLAEMGVKTLKRYKTDEDNRMLDYLRRRNVTTLNELVLKI
jgi:AraC-like DNA-binding protein